MVDIRQQVVTGITPPQLGEANIRETWPSVARNPAVAGLGRMLTGTIFLAPLGWLLMSGLYFSKVLPVVGRRYTLTNRRLMIRGGWSGKPVQEVPLGEIDDIHIKTDSNSDFFRAATLEVISGGQVRMRLPGTPGPEAFRIAVLNARRAWAPREDDRKAFVAASAAK